MFSFDWRHWGIRRSKARGSLHPTKRRASRVPRLEQLEDRCLLNAATDAQLVVRELYAHVLDRAPDAGQAFWVQQVLAGGSRLPVAQGFWESGEHRAMQVDQLYATLLHRGADPGGRIIGTTALIGGTSERAVA